MDPLLLIFIDSYPYEFVSEMPFLSSHFRWQVECGIGYSVNVKAELFAGLRPDDLGYMNEWTFAPEHSRFRSHHWWLRLIDPVKHFYYADRVAHRLLQKFVFRQGLINIPFTYLRYFTKRGTPPYYDGFEFPSLFSMGSHLKIVRYSDFPFSPHRDEEVFRQARRVIEHSSEGDSIFIAWADLDNFTHVNGVGSPQHLQKIKELDRMVGDCVDDFRKRNPNGRFLFVSDHSMANVTKHVSFEPEKMWGRVSPETYVYFTDSNILRLWVFDSEVKKKIAEFLNNWGEGKLLSQEERSRFSITEPIFGDLIYILNEGTVFYPSFWGRGSVAAMHGYHPDTESQKGCVVSDQQIFASKMIPKSTEVYSWLKEQLCQS